MNILKNCNFEPFLFPYKKCGNENRTYVNKGCILLNSYFLKVLLSIPFDKLPWFDEFFEEPTAQAAAAPPVVAAAPTSIGESSGSICVLFVGTGTRVGRSIDWGAETWKIFDLYFQLGTI